MNNAFQRNFHKTGQKTPNLQCSFNRNYVHSRRPRGNFPYNFIMWHHIKYINSVVGDGWRYIFIFKKRCENVPRSSYMTASYKNDKMLKFSFENRMKVCNLVLYIQMCWKREMCILMRLIQLLKFRANI